MLSITFGRIVVLLFVAAALKILREWERGVILRLGTFHAVRGPGITFVVPLHSQAAWSASRHPDCRSVEWRAC